VFVWEKKAQLLGQTKSQAKRAAKAQREANLVEMDKAKLKREARELEMQQRIMERDRERRDRDGDNFETLSRNEQEFSRRQRRQAAVLSINQCRERPADLLARNMLLVRQLEAGGPEVGPDGKPVAALEEFVGAFAQDPGEFVTGLSRPDLEEVKRDLPLILWALEPVDYMRGVLVVCEDALVGGGATAHLPRQVEAALIESCRNRSRREIASERMDAQRKMRAADSAAAGGGQEPQYWAAVASRLAVEEARAMVSELHEQLLGKLKRFGRFAHAPPEEPAAAPHMGDAPPHLANHSVPGYMHDELFSEQVDLPTSDPSLIKPKSWNRIRRANDRRGHPYVAGYRFNIFYPDLVRGVPSYEVKPKDDTTDIITFKAGPPYADVAFQVFHGEWKRDQRSAYKSKFEDGQLYLYFDIRRPRYRR
jgi:hypothetical protein